MSRLIFIRHGETDMAGTFCGQSNPGLNAAGRRQAIQAAEQLAGCRIQRVFSSDLQRASQSAQIIGDRIGIQAELRQGLREIHFGEWEGQTWQEIESRFPREAETWLKEFPMRAAPQGELYSGFTARVRSELLALCKTENSTIAVVTHRGVIRYALTELFGFAESEAWTQTEAYGAVIALPALRMREIECLPVGGR